MTVRATCLEDDTALIATILAVSVLMALTEVVLAVILAFRSWSVCIAPFPEQPEASTAPMMEEEACATENTPLLIRRKADSFVYTKGLMTVQEVSSFESLPSLAFLSAPLDRVFWVVKIKSLSAVL